VPIRIVKPKGSGDLFSILERVLLQDAVGTYDFPTIHFPLIVLSNFLNHLAGAVSQESNNISTQFSVNDLPGLDPVPFQIVFAFPALH